jgi:type IV fimbrial biogenesis protein FimT
MMKARRGGGFTLIEAMVTVAMIALLLSLAWPSFGSRLAHHRLAAAAEGLAQDAAEARFQAAQEGRALHITFGGSGADWCYAVARSPGCPCTGESACQLKTVSASELPGVQLSAPRDLAFDPTATEVDGGGAEFMSTRGERLRVSVSRLGRAQVCASAPTSGYRDC